LQKLKDGYFESLGVNALWLTVPMDNTDGIGIGDDGRNYTGYHGYWPRDLSKPERRFGTESELKAVIAEAHKRGIKILVDYAMNHVHKDAPVYAMNKSWFNPLDLGGGRQCICGSSDCPWEGGKATACWFRDYLPDFDFNNSAARNFSVENALWWMKNYDLDGFRLDAVKHIEQVWLTDLRDRITKEVELVGKAAHLPRRRDVHRQPRPHQSVHRSVQKTRRPVRLSAPRRAGEQGAAPSGPDAGPRKLHGLERQLLWHRAQLDVHRQPRRAALDSPGAEHAAVERHLGRWQRQKLRPQSPRHCGGNRSLRATRPLGGDHYDQSWRAAHLLRR
jgi:glycosidase